MTIEEFNKTYCTICGSLICIGEPDEIAHCGYYQGDIEGINKMYDKEAYEKKIEAVCEELRNDPEFNKLLNKLSEYLKNK